MPSLPDCTCWDYENPNPTEHVGYCPYAGFSGTDPDVPSAPRGTPRSALTRRFVVYSDSSGRFTARRAGERIGEGGLFEVARVNLPLTPANRDAAYEALVRMGGF